LRDEPELTARRSGTTFLSTEGADDGIPHGFDDLATSAFASEYDRSTLTWPEIEVWYRAHLAGIRWPDPTLVASGEGLLFRRESSSG
jgi:hypothetical protein